MTTPIPIRVLEAWEHARAVPPAQRPVVLLTYWHPPGTNWEQMPLGQRDSHLLLLREQWAGPLLDCLAECPECRTVVEFSVPAHDLRSPAPPDLHPMTLTLDGRTLTLRLPHSGDLLAASAEKDIAAARRVLFSRCLLSATRADGSVVAPEPWIESDLLAAGEFLAKADTLADPSFALSCPQCNAAWVAPFDLAGFLWQELQTWVRRLLDEVHDLALAYGWAEADILALSPARRQAYLQRLRV